MQRLSYCKSVWVHLVFPVRSAIIKQIDDRLLQQAGPSLLLLELGQSGGAAPGLARAAEVGAEGEVGCAVAPMGASGALAVHRRRVGRKPTGGATCKSL